MQGVFKHYKGGMYTAIMSARCSDNGTNEGENVVVYVSHATGAVCTRLAREFCGDVFDESVGHMKKRFEFVASVVGAPK